MLSGASRFACELEREVEAPLPIRLAPSCFREFSHPLLTIFSAIEIPFGYSAEQYAEGCFDWACALAQHDSY